MDRWEALARRYCAICGRDPDRAEDGLPEWEAALDELCAAMTALDTFDLDVRERFESPAANDHEPDARGSAEIIPFPAARA